MEDATMNFICDEMEVCVDDKNACADDMDYNDDMDCAKDMDCVDEMDCADKSENEEFIPTVVITDPLMPDVIDESMTPSMEDDVLAMMRISDAIGQEATPPASVLKSSEEIDYDFVNFISLKYKNLGIKVFL